MDNIITAVFTAGQMQTVAELPLYQWAYGQRLQFEGLELPEYYQVDFSNFEFCGASIPQIGGADGVSVPVEVLATGAPVYAFVWLQDETGGKTAYRVTVSVIPRPAPDFGPTSPEEESAVAQAIVALNDNAEDAEAWAIGERDGVPVAPGDPTYENNAKYYAEHSGGGGGTSDYTDLTNKPSINSVTLFGNKTASDLGLGTYSKPSGGIPASDLASGVIPTKTSDLTNDSGFTTHGVPSGGTSGQVLKKSSSTDYAVEWANESGGGGDLSETHPTGWRNGAIMSTSGKISRNYNGNRAFSSKPIPANVVKIEILDGATALLAAYNDGAYVGEWTGDGWEMAYHTITDVDLKAIRRAYPSYDFYLLVYASADTAGSYVKYTIDNSVELPDTTMLSSSPYSAIGEVAETYLNVAYDANDIIRYMDRLGDAYYGLYFSNTEYDGIKRINCTQFVYALLTGTKYEASRYVKDSNSPALWGWQTDGSSTHYDPFNCVYDDFMFSQYLAEYFDKKGLLHEYVPGHSNIQRGDIFFAANPTSYPDRYKNVHHVAVVFNVAGDALIKTIDGGGGMTRRVDGEPVAIGIATWDLLAAGKKFYYAHCPLPLIRTEHELVAESTAFISYDVSVPAGDNLLAGEVAELGPGLYTAVFEDLGDPLLRPALRVFYGTGSSDYIYYGNRVATGKQYVPFHIQTGMWQIEEVINNGHSEAMPLHGVKVRIYRGLLGPAYSAPDAGKSGPNASDSAPAMDGTAAAGSSDSYARADHVHPTDTTRLAANQGAANAGKFLVVGNDGVVVPVAAPSGGSEWTSLYDADLTEDIAAIAFSNLNAKEIAVFFDGRINLSDDSASNANETVAIKINGTKVQQGAYCYVRGSGSKTQTIFRYEVIGGTTFGYANAYQNGSGAGAFGAQGGKKDAQSIESISITPITSGHLFKSGGHLTAMWR